MRCVSCDNPLTGKEMSRVSTRTGLHLDMCSRCCKSAGITDYKDHPKASAQRHYVGAPDQRELETFEKMYGVGVDDSSAE